MARGIAIGEAHPFTRKSIDARRPVVVTAVAAEVLPAEIINEDEDNVGHVCVRRGRCGRRAKIQREDGGDEDEIPFGRREEPRG